MVTFGFSSFLKLLSLNEKPQRTEIRKRLGPSLGNGYDFHRSLRLHARRHLVLGEAMADVIASAGSITRVSERQSAVAALHRLEAWRTATPGEVLNFDAAIFESPPHLFKVRFEPAFGLRMHGQTTAIHIWNTQRPKLAAGPTYAALALARKAYQGQEGAPEDIGILSLREPGATYLLSDVPDQIALAASFVKRIEEIIEGTPLPPPRPEDRPAA